MESSTKELITRIFMIRRVSSESTLCLLTVKTLETQEGLR